MSLDRNISSQNLLPLCEEVRNITLLEDKLPEAGALWGDSVPSGLLKSCKAMTASEPSSVWNIPQYYIALGFVQPNFSYWCFSENVKNYEKFAKEEL